MSFRCPTSPLRGLRTRRLIAAASLVVAPVALAVDLDAAPAAPAVFAEEIVATLAAPVTLTNAGAVLDLSTPLAYSFTQGEVRHARIACPEHVRFLAGSAVVASDAPSTNIGAINGIGGSVITFSVTAVTTGLTAADRLTVTGNREITSTEDARCTFALYDQPSQAQAGGATGRIVEVGGPYLDFSPSYSLRVLDRNRAIADVEAVNGPFTAFTLAAPTNDRELGALGRFDYGTAAAVLGVTQPLKADGTPITLTDLMAAETALTFPGDFSPAADVFLSSAPDCSLVDLTASLNDGQSLRFDIGDLALLGTTLCYRAGVNEVFALDTSVTLEPVAASAAYAVTSRGPEALGGIDRNGTELQAPLVQMDAGSIARVVLTNTGSEKRNARLELVGASSGSASEASSTYIGVTSVDVVIPIDGAIVVNLAEAFPLQRFTGPPRGFVHVTVSGPNNQIQGLYQIVNPQRGTLSNHVMVRPGTN